MSAVEAFAGASVDEPLTPDEVRDLIEQAVFESSARSGVHFLPPQDPPSPLYLLPMEPGRRSLTPILEDFPRAVFDDEPGSESDLAGEVLEPFHPETPGWSQRVLRRFAGLFDTWTSRIALGGRSLVGNSNQNFIDLLADFENKTEVRATQINLGGQFGESNETIVANRWFANSTTDFYHQRGWLTFTKLMDQYDQLQNLDYRGTFSAGIGYRFLFDDQRRIITRLGPGVTFEIFHDPSNSRTTPDLFGELELRLPVWQRLKWEQKSTVFPSLSELAVARAQSQTTILYSFDERERWSLRVGLLYQFISQPNVGKVPSDYTTNVSIMYQRK